jgi:MFS family permease
VSLFLTGTAVASAASATTFNHLGRRGGFIFGCLFQMVGSIIAMIGMLTKSVPALLLGCFVIGIGLGYGHFYRFAVIELSPEEMQRYI